MSKQAHDLGVRKRRNGDAPLPPGRLQWLRVKRRHPGPLPPVLQEFGAWVKAGKPRRIDALR